MVDINHLVHTCDWDYPSIYSDYTMGWTATNMLFRSGQGQEIFVSSEASRQALELTKSPSQEIHVDPSLPVNVIEV